METIPYYDPKLGESADALRERVKVCLKKEGNPPYEMRVLTHWLCEHFMPEDRGRLVPTPDADTLSSEGIKYFDACLHRTCLDTTGWHAISESPSLPGAWLNSTQTSWNTRQVLGLALYDLLEHGNEPVPDVFTRLGSTFQHKFEVFGRIYSLYDGNWRKVNEDCADTVLYAFLGLFLLCLVRKTSDLSFLSTALKIADLLTTATPSLNTLFETVSGLAMIEAGDNALHKLYDDHEFRLPSDQ